MRNTITKQEIKKQIEESNFPSFLKYSISEETSEYHDFIELDVSFQVDKSTMDIVFHIFSYENHYILIVYRYYWSYRNPFTAMKDTLYRNKNIKKKKTIIRKITELLGGKK